MNPPILDMPRDVLSLFSNLVRGHISLVNVTVKMKLLIGIQTHKGYKNGSTKNATILIVMTNM